MATKLILINEVDGLGAAGDVVEVKDGYARNFLVPQGFAVRWTRGGQKQVDTIRAARAARELAGLEEAQRIAAALEETRVRLYARAGKEGRLFGSVKVADVAEAVAAAEIATVDRRKVVIPVPIRTVGNHTATVKLHPEVVATINLQVIAQK